MAKQVITFGTPPTGIGGDSYRTAFGKCNENFTEVYDKIAYFDGAPKAASSFSIYRDVLSNYRATASLTGALVIHLPKAKNKSTTMLSLRIRGYNYLNNKGEWDLQVGGYNYSSGWQQVSANLNGPAPFTQVQLGMASDHQVIIIGTASTVWAYPRFNIEEITAGYANHASGWNTGLSVEYETDLSAYTGLVTPVLYGWPQVLTAEKLTTARTIGGVSFDGSANINLPGVNTAGNQNTSGNAASATKLATARTINGVSFNGTANITIADSTKLPLAGGTLSGQLIAPKLLINHSSTTASGISWYNTSYNSWQDYMAQGGSTGNGVRGNLTAPLGTYVTSWARRSVIEPSAGFGWTFETMTNSGTSPTIVAELSKDGAFKTAGDIHGTNLTVSGKVNTTQFSSASPYSFLNGGAAQNIMTGGLLASNAYSDITKVPTNGIYSKGKVQADGGFQGALTGNASTATKLATARTISLTGAVTGSVSFDGSGNASITTAVGSTVAITKGGTGASTAAAARTNLDVYSKAEIDSTVNGKIDIIPYLPLAYPKDVPPTGYLALMGQAISQATYPILYSLYGATLPDLRGQFLRGLDYGRGIDTDRVVLSEQEDAFKSHTHTTPSRVGSQPMDPVGAWTYRDAASGGVTGATGDSETRPKNIAFLYIVKAG